ncbi:hypothetical protein ACHAW5_008729 [Stephanodiscus triporus]|uniref:DUF6824 domain-containing protein n=1 Tax=Stephanodiscus triporus TaxID=2934178 RepID=A0ABD3N9X3_9STRA
MFGHNVFPLTGIVEVRETDIICGRGGLPLKHAGNATYRKIVNLNREIYATCPKTEKLRISKSIVAAVRDINARFIEREDGKVSQSLDEKDEAGNPVTWRDIGDKRAIEKTSQALREGQPKLLKKLKQDREESNSEHRIFSHSGEDVLDDTGVNYFIHANHGGAAPHQFSLAQPLQEGVRDNCNHILGDVQMLGSQLPSQYSLQSQQSESFTQASLVGAHTMSTPSFLSLGDAQPRQEVSFGEINHVPTKYDSSNMDKREKWMHCSIGTMNTAETTDSWGEVYPKPLPFNVGPVFSTDDNRQLMSCLGVSEDGHVDDDKSALKRSSVRFRLEDWKKKSSMSLISGISHVSDLSISHSFFSLSLDSAMDAAEREAELECIGELDISGSCEISWGGHGNAQTCSGILQRSNKPMTSAANHYADPGLIFTSTLDSKPGGVNAGIDISGLLGDNRKSDLKFEDIIHRRRSSRMSMCSALTDFSATQRRSTRSLASMFSMQSADWRDLMQRLDDSDDSDDDDKDDEEIKQNI